MVHIINAAGVDLLLLQEVVKHYNVAFEVIEKLKMNRQWVSGSALKASIMDVFVFVLTCCLHGRSGSIVVH